MSDKFGLQTIIPEATDHGAQLLRYSRPRSSTASSSENQMRQAALEADADAAAASLAPPPSSRSESPSRRAPPRARRFCPRCETAGASRRLSSVRARLERSGDPELATLSLLVREPERSWARSARTSSRWTARAAAARDGRRSCGPVPGLSAEAAAAQVSRAAAPHGRHGGRPPPRSASRQATPCTCAASRTCAAGPGEHVGHEDGRAAVTRGDVFSESGGGGRLFFYESFCKKKNPFAAAPRRGHARTRSPSVSLVSHLTSRFS